MLTGKTHAHSITRGDLIRFRGQLLTITDNRRDEKHLPGLTNLIGVNADGVAFSHAVRHNTPINRIVGGRS